MKQILLMVVACLLVLPLGATEPTIESVEKLFVISKVQASLDAVRAGMDQRMKTMMEQMMKAYPDNPKLQEAGIELGQRMGRELAETLRWEKLKDDYLKLYRETFTQEEVDAQIAYYESPAGKSAAEKMPAVSVKSSQIVQQHYLPLMQEMQKTIKETMAKAVRKN